MTEQEAIRKREVAYEKAVNSLLELVNAITEERNFYKEKCDRYEKYSNT